MWTVLAFLVMNTLSMTIFSKTDIFTPSVLIHIQRIFNKEFQRTKIIHRYKILIKPNIADVTLRRSLPRPVHLWSVHAATSQRLLLPLLYADFILCVIFCANAARSPPPPLPNNPLLPSSPPTGAHTPWGLYLADDLLRAHSSEVSACRGGFNDVGGSLADSLRRLFRGPLLFNNTMPYWKLNYSFIWSPMYFFFL